jgi:hypothetical protein
MGDFYGIKPGTVPGFAESGAGRFVSVDQRREEGKADPREDSAP